MHTYTHMYTHTHTHLSQSALQAPQEVVIFQGTSAVVQVIHTYLERLNLFKLVVHLYGGGKLWVQCVLQPFCATILQVKKENWTVFHISQAKKVWKRNYTCLHFQPTKHQVLLLVIIFTTLYSVNILLVRDGQTDISNQEREREKHTDRPSTCLASDIIAPETWYSYWACLWRLHTSGCVWSLVSHSKLFETETNYLLLVNETATSWPHKHVTSWTCDPMTPLMLHK